MPNYECKICDYITDRISNYKQHCNSLKHKDIAVDKNFCDICKKEYSTRKNLLDHNNYKHRELNIKLINKPKKN